MSLLPYALARPFLFGLDPETAHELTMASLARTQGTPLALAYLSSRVSDPIELAGLKFPNRVGLAAGVALRDAAPGRRGRPDGDRPRPDRPLTRKIADSPF